MGGTYKEKNYKSLQKEINMWTKEEACVLDGNNWIFLNDDFPLIEISYNSKQNHSRNFWGPQNWLSFSVCHLKKIHVQEYFENKEEESKDYKQGTGLSHPANKIVCKTKGKRDSS